MTFLQKLNEIFSDAEDPSVQPLKKELELLNSSDPFVLADTYITKVEGNPAIELSSIQVKRDAPSGTGSNYMKKLTDIADKYGVVIVLQTASKGNMGKDGMYKKTSSVDRLKKFYSNFGFKYNYGKRSYRADLPGNMHRLPKI